MKLSEIYWLAGWYEGEGSCYNAKNGRNGGGSIIWAGTTTDLDTATKVVNILGPKAHIYTWIPTKKYAAKLPQYRIRIFGTDAAGWLMTLYPLLGNRRRQQVAKVLAHWRGTGRNSH